MEVFSFLVGTQITGQLCFQDGSLAASCSATQKQQPALTREIKRQISPYHYDLYNTLTILMLN